MIFGTLIVPGNAGEQGRENCQIQIFKRTEVNVKRLAKNDHLLFKIVTTDKKSIQRRE